MPNLNKIRYISTYSLRSKSLTRDFIIGISVLFKRTSRRVSFFLSDPRATKDAAGNTSEPARSRVFEQAFNGALIKDLVLGRRS